MVKVKLVRGYQNNQATLGLLSIENLNHQPIFTLENPKRETTKDSLIPAGTYTCVPYSSLKYPNVYEVQNVPGRSAILIHSGNTELDTLGCILVGLSAGMMKAQPAVMSSIQGLNYLKSLLGQNNFTLEIVDQHFPPL